MATELLPDRRTAPPIVPIRHHSPAAALQVRRLIRERRPRLVLIEGPADATPLIPLLADPGTVPPIALYAYRPGAEGRALFYPFCAYSPEYVAFATAREVGAEARFCDVPASVSLDWPKEDQGDGPEQAVDAVDFGSFAAALSDAAGTSSFEELWEAAFEQGTRTPDDFVALLGEFGDKARALAPPTRDALREQYMAATLGRALAEGLPPEAVVVVCGAAHAGPIAAALQDAVEPPALAAAETAEIALIPFSYPRLSEQSGYGAGNRAPWFYQQVWQHDNDYAVATRRALIALAARLRRTGQPASLAQCIDAYNLALVLARLREKVAPGVDELGDAATACFGAGQTAVVQAALREVLVGDALGQVTRRVGKTPLQSEFYATANRLGLPVLDAPRQVLLHMTNLAEAERSIFLHRLAVAGIPFGREIGSGLRSSRGPASLPSAFKPRVGGGRTGGARPGTAGTTADDDPLAQLGRVREKWELQWSPETDAALVERTAWGNTLADVCGRLLGKQLDGAGAVDQATDVLLRLALCDLAESLPAALDRCETLAADSASFPALARAAYHLDGLLTYGAARRLPVDALASLARRLFARAILHLPTAATGGDEAAAEVERTLISLYELVRRESPIVEDPAAFWDAVGRATEAPGCHPGLRGLGLVLLELGGKLSPGELSARLRYWLSAAAEAADNARLVAGLFALHRGTLVRNQALIAAVTEFLAGLAIDELIPLLPVLRRTLGNLSAAERAYLTETLAAVLGMDHEPDGNGLELTDADIEHLRAADREVAAVLANWRERYGLG